MKRSLKTAAELLSMLALATVCLACVGVTRNPPAKRPFDAVLASEDVDAADARRDYFEARKAIVRDFLETSDLLGAVDESRSLASDLSGTGVADFARQDQAQWEQFLGNYRTALEVFPPREPRFTDPLPKPLSHYRPRDAVEALAEAARDERAVFVNEWHHIPQHRAFTLRLLPELRRLGFTHFAAEALSHDDPELATRGYPVHGLTGWYVHEALLGDVIRTALELGFEVVPYEFPGAPDVREEGQARRLFEATLARDPEARIFVYTGMGHNRRDLHAYDGVGSMLWHFERLSGIRAFTVDQLAMTERARAVEESPAYRDVTEALDFEQPIVLVDETDGQAIFTTPGYDAVVFSPRVRQVSGRPHWLRLDGARRDVALPLDPCGGKARCLAEVRHTDEPDRAIPLDRVEFEVGEAADPPRLFLPAGRFRLRIVGPGGEILRESLLAVD